MFFVHGEGETERYRSPSGFSADIYDVNVGKKGDTHTHTVGYRDGKAEYRERQENVN